MAPVHHLVLLHATADANIENISKICEAVLELEESCTQNGRKYIRSIVGGRDRSIEGLQAGITHAFVVEFESAEDRDYYVKEDGAHKAVANLMMSSVGTDLATAQVVDFTPGTF